MNQKVDQPTAPGTTEGVRRTPASGLPAPAPCECPARKALQDLVKALHDTGHFGVPISDAIAALALPCPCQQLQADLEEALDALQPFADDESDPNDERRAIRVLAKHQKPAPKDAR
jgi:hypothetical protein